MRPYPRGKSVRDILAINYPDTKNGGGDAGLLSEARWIQICSDPQGNTDLIRNCPGAGISPHLPHGGCPVLWISKYRKYKRIHLCFVTLHSFFLHLEIMTANT